jgi:hypothetical protein
MPLSRHPPERRKQLVEFGIDSICKRDAISGDPGPDLKKIILRFGGDVLQRRH